MDAEQIIEQVWKKYDDPNLRIIIKATAKNNEEVLMNDYERLHSRLIVEWAQNLFGKQDAVSIAAAAHDWDRAFPEIRVPFEDSLDKYWDYKIAHSINSSKIFYNVFKDSIESNLMKDIVYLIKRHEIGGKRDENKSLIFTPDSTNSFNLEAAADIIQTSDSISGFISFLEKGPSIEARGDKYGLKKIGFYYGRASDKAREIIDSIDIKNHLLINLFAKYKQENSIVQDIDYGLIEEKFNQLDC